MQPQQPYQPPASPNAAPNGNYDFILNPAPQPHRSLLGGGGLAMRLLVVFGGLFILIVVASVLLSALNKNSNFDKAAMLSIAQDETELITLSTSGAENSVSQNNKDFSVITQLSMTTDRTNLLTYLSSKHYKVSAKALPLKHSLKTDTALTDAKSASAYDVAYKGIMQQRLETYRQDITVAYKTTDSKSGKTLLNTEYDNAGLLLTKLANEPAKQ